MSKNGVVLVLIFAFALIANNGKAQGFLMLAGGSSETNGGWSDAPYGWVVDHAANKRIAVISYNQETAWIPNYFKSLGALEAKNFYIPDFATANSQSMYDSLVTYDGVFLKGGDQSVYYESYLNSKTQEALQAIYNSGGVLSGTSAGMAILSPIVYTAQGAYIYPGPAIANPYSEQITLKDDFLFTLDLPYIFDTHFVQRGRFGRLPAFMANWYKNNKIAVIGIGVDDRTALCIDQTGNASVYGTAAANFYFPAEDVLPFDTTITMFRTGSMKTVQLLHGCNINLNTGDVTGLSQAITPAVIAENEKITVVLSGSDQVSDAACAYFVNQEGAIDDTIVIVTGSSLLLANNVKNLLQNQGAESVMIIQALPSALHDVLVGQAIQQGRKFLFIGNNYNELMEFTAGEGNGIMLNAKIRQPLAVSFFAGDNARFAGETVVNKYMGAGFASYYGELEFDPGLGLLNTTAIMPNTFLNEDIYENTVSGLPYAMITDSLAFGLYLTGNTFCRYSWDVDNTTFFESLGGSFPLIVMQNLGCHADVANQGPYASSRNVAGFDSMQLQFLAPSDKVNAGAINPNFINDSDVFGMQIFPNPVHSSCSIRLAPGEYALSISDVNGRVIQKQNFNDQTSLSVTQFSAGVYFLQIEKKGSPGRISHKLMVY